MNRMKRLLWLSLLFMSPMLSEAQDGIPASGFLDPQTAQKPNEPESAQKPNPPQSAQKPSAGEEQIYASATDALNNGNYDSAISGFERVAAMKGRRASGALYWKAYALNRARRRNEALAAIAQLRREYPQSSYVDDAKKLEAEIRPEDPESVSDDEMKLIAIDALMNTDPEKAVPILEKLLQGNSSFKVKDRALFVLAQHRSDKAQQILLSIAKGGSQPELQTHAIKWLAVGGPRNNQILREIYSTSTNDEVKEQVLKSFIINGDKEGLMTIIRQEKSPELRHEAFKQLGPMGARDEIRQLYKEAADAESKKELLRAMGIAGDAQGLIEAAKTETDAKVRSEAIRNVGIFGGRAAVEALVSIYNSNNDVQTKKEVIRALFIHGAAKELVDLARKETNPELRKELVRNLSIMHSPEATEYMMEILNK